MGYFIPQSAINNLKNYKYQSEDHSLISQYVLGPFWRKTATIFPRNMAPNLITLSGFAFILINDITVLYYDPTLTQSSPTWTFYSYALGLFLYQTFDACDGLHARRIGQSGPLGELFDHCIDSINTTLSMLPFCSAFKMGYTWLFPLLQFGLLLNFYLSTWEEYYTQKLYLSSFSGPVEGILSITILFLLKGLFGFEIPWHLPLIQLGTITVEFVCFIYILVGIAIAFNVYTSIKNVQSYYDNHTTSDPTNTNNSAIIQNQQVGLVPFIGFYVSIMLLILVDQRIINLPFILMSGLIIAFMVGRIIVAHLTLQPFPTMGLVSYIPLFQLGLYKILISYYKLDSNLVIMMLTGCGFGLALGIHAMFINEVIYEFTTYLDVYALSIKHPKNV
ncbi:hypothetical protein TBLA_0B01190 [Henningerozyma blattae CBS 6284]|uniref:Uncharacterized protein n=1 Tax=Henningerozyma blattae (strain ATCC 34711 / CBS 6284 / DSM 70876 / NBRC 10599 / NRRL Y-10934 / UCD 77-7) TaxID=1071380 RepID=I2GXW0_HENB6|nr:hypothetical protein TBLA_0B01190 [Tetrapisispora blattae CBS 6284]CCH58962.1 hypothetical protein TBLA_0B01190 [Tetrapisispora blattae CBS 6284]